MSFCFEVTAPNEPDRNKCHLQVDILTEPLSDDCESLFRSLFLQLPRKAFFSFRAKTSFQSGRAASKEWTKLVAKMAVHQNFEN